MATKAPATIADEISRYRVTHLQMTPSLARMLTLDPRAFAALGSLKQMLLGGEAVPAALIHHLRQVFKGEIHNMYGPTETTIWSTTCRIEDVGSTVSIGRPIANTQIYMLDAELNPVPPGEIGELFIGGDGVARGYWKRPDLTAERFLTIPALTVAATSTHLSHRRSGALSSRRQHRFPGPRRLSDQAARSPHRAGRDRGAAGKMPGHSPGRRHPSRRPRGRQAPGGLSGRR